MDILKAALREVFGKLELQKENEKLYNVFKNDKQPLDINDKQFKKLLKESNLNDTKISLSVCFVIYIFVNISFVRLTTS